MRIDPQIPASESSATSAVNDSKSGAAKTAQAPSVGEPSDTVQLSSNQATVSKLVEQSSQVPDVRTERVAALRSQVQSGQYRPSNEQVAGAIVNDLFGAGSQA
jgi:negative regulator of flagellin synthesis FlgM